MPLEPPKIRSDTWPKGSGYTAYSPIRSAVYWEHRTHLFAEQVRSLFDDGVGLARRLVQHHPRYGAPVLAQILTDRSTFHTAAREFGPALDDFREALSYLGEAG
ncbi:hypothetical protein [Streptomyces sp. NBC_01314]|uniref:hypothetical protein n=1 Tax=Streptomyces sp. NBC_01314 TaxID=2903821 RepID=UPI0030865FD7|nr:hypothetical protein OG622_07260 [Streptomyces sp. NBC_01314]